MGSLTDAGKRMTAVRTKKITLWAAMAMFPPYYVRLLAKSGGVGAIKAMSDAEVAIASGIDINRIREIKFMTTWDRVTYREIVDYTMACNFDPTSPKDRMRVRNYENICKMRNATPFQYLKVSPKYESEFLPLLKILKAQLQQQPSAA